MKKALHLSILLFCCCSAANAQAHKQQEHTTALQFRVGGVYMTAVNAYARELGHKDTPYLSYPYGMRRFLVYGPMLHFVVNDSSNISDFIDGRTVVNIKGREINGMIKLPGEVRNRPNPLIPRRFDDRSPGPFPGVTINGLQVRLQRNGATTVDWKPIKSFRRLPIGPGTANGRRAYVVSQDSLKEGDELDITFRTTNDTSLIRFRFFRAVNEFAPMLVMYKSDSSRLSFTGFIERVLNDKENFTSGIHYFYRYWPDRHTLLTNQVLPAGTKLALAFRKPDPNYPDETLEYMLSTGPVHDSAWQTASHIIFVPPLKPGTDYSLLVRYRTSPGHLRVYTFYTLPEWYQRKPYRYFLWGSISLVIALFFWWVLRWRVRRERKQTELLRQRLRSIRAQLNPHFIFNALGSIQGLMNKNEIARANHYLSEFSVLLRDTLKSNQKDGAPLSAELKLLSSYLLLEQLRSDFDYKIDVDPSIDVHTTEMPPLLLQPLVENAVKHGIAGMQDSGRIRIRFSMQHNDLLVTITDNGIGFDEQLSTEGYGLALTRERIALLNRNRAGQRLRLDIISTPNGGTTVHLSFKNWL